MTALLQQPDFRAWVRRRLLAWFSRHARDLPWRRRRDPYAVWISEVMLQQTQVVTVIPYFERFLATFPDVNALANADEQSVLRVWEGLGYYRRARALHQAARCLRDDHASELPNDPDLLAELPGLGRYTVNAILSQAYERRFPILEANSRRVLCRLLGVRGDVSRGPGEQLLWQAAKTLLPRRRVGDFNQALMELGALVCAPAAPACGQCPLAQRCAALRLGLQHEIPTRPTKPRVEAVREVAVAVWRRSRVLLVQRPSEGRWANMWELPRRVVVGTATPESTAQELLDDLGLRADLGPEVATVRHGVTRFRITLTCLDATLRSGKFQPGVYPRGRWLAPAQLADHPLSRPQRRLAAALAQARPVRLFSSESH